MPPEQAAGKRSRAGHRRVRLSARPVCLLTGRPPFLAATLMDTLLQVLEQEPVRPAAQPGSAAISKRFA